MADELTPAEERVKAYLDEQIKQDGALLSFYVPSKIKACYEYIEEEARKVSVSGKGGRYAFVDDGVVFKWARDYFIEVLPKEADKATVEIVQKKVEAEAKKIEEAMKKSSDKKLKKAVKSSVEELQGLLFAFNENSVAV